MLGLCLRGRLRVVPDARAPVDARYESVLACHDPGESDLAGGLIYARVGRGVFVYTGLVFFRELPSGVPGAYRLLANLVSFPKANAARGAAR